MPVVYRHHVIMLNFISQCFLFSVSLPEMEDSRRTDRGFRYCFVYTACAYAWVTMRACFSVKDGDLLQTCNLFALLGNYSGQSAYVVRKRMLFARECCSCPILLAREHLV
jgi:hypothetical protein